MHKKKKIKDEALIYIVLIMLILAFILTGFGKNVSNFFNVLTENLFLIKDRNIIVSEESTKVYIKSLESDITELKQLIFLNKTSGYNCINSTVIYRDPTYWYNTLTINKGILDGVKKGDMVVSSTGLVGVVKDTKKSSSIVALLTNLESKMKITVGIKTDEELVYGLINNYDFIKNEIIINQVTKDIKYIDGMDVITTDFTNTYPKGILIGIVKEIIDDKNSLSKIIKVIPNADFNNIKYVCVVGGV